MSVTEKVQEMYQVRIMKTNKREPSFKCRKNCRRYQNWGCFVAPGRVWGEPVYCPYGTRHRDGVSIIQAFMWNCGNLSQQKDRERHKQQPCEADNIELLHRGGQIRSSVEGAIMAVEQRDLVVQSAEIDQLLSRRSQWK